MEHRNEPKLTVLVAESGSNVERWVEAITDGGEYHVQALIQAEEEPLADFAARVGEQLGSVDGHSVRGNIARVYWLRGRFLNPGAGGARAILAQTILGRLRNRHDLLTTVAWPGTGRLRKDDRAIVAELPADQCED